MTIENISDTARWVAEYRAMETDRPDAIFRDPYARRLAGAKGGQIVDTLRQGRRMAVPMIVRTKVFDELILERVQAGADLVLNLAAGLDTRPWRLDLPASLRWVDVDLPAILEHKTTEMRHEKPRCCYEAVKLDLREADKRKALFAALGAEHTQVLVVAEGLLVYLEPSEVADLARALYAAPSFRWWVIDLASPRLLQFMQRSWGRDVHKGNAPFKFAPTESTKFFEPCGWREAAFHSMTEEGRRLKREFPMMWLWRFVLRLYPARIRAQFKRFSGFVLLERT